MGFSSGILCDRRGFSVRPKLMRFSLSVLCDSWGEFLRSLGSDDSTSLTLISLSLVCNISLNDFPTYLNSLWIFSASLVTSVGLFIDYDGSCSQRGLIYESEEEDFCYSYDFGSIYYSRHSTFWVISSKDSIAWVSSLCSDLVSVNGDWPDLSINSLSIFTSFLTESISL